MKRTLAINTINKEEQEVMLIGWVQARRDHGKLVFIDIRDRSGIAQVVFGPEIKEAGDLRLEYLIKVNGLVLRTMTKEPALLVFLRHQTSFIIFPVPNQPPVRNLNHLEARLGQVYRLAV